MKKFPFAVAFAFCCLILESCTLPGLKLGNSPKKPMPTLDFSHSNATLTSVSTLPFLIGQLTVTGAIPLFFMVDEKDPEQSVILFGKGTGVAVLNSGAKGSGYKEGYSSSYPQTAEWPVEYHVTGFLIPSRGECSIKLTIDEHIFLSKQVVMHGSPLGDMPITGGTDQVSTIPDLIFTETKPVATRVYGGSEYVFTIEDWCLPKETQCTLGCTAE
jgi:hypothetical protein